MPYTDDLALLDDDIIREARMQALMRECPLSLEHLEVRKYRMVNGKLIELGKEVWDGETACREWARAQMSDNTRDIYEEENYQEQVHSVILTDEKSSREMQEALEQTWQEPVPRRLMLAAPLEQRFLSADEVNDVLTELVMNRGHVSEKVLDLLDWEEEPSDIQLMDLLERYGWMLKDEAAIIAKLGVRFMRDYASANTQYILDQMSDPRDTSRDNPWPQDAELSYAADVFERELEEHFKADEEDHKRYLEKIGRKPYLASPVYNMTKIRAIASGISSDEASNVAWEAYKRDNDMPLVIGATVHGLKTERGIITWHRLPRVAQKGLKMPDGALSKLVKFLQDNGISKGVEAVETCRSLLSGV